MNKHYLPILLLFLSCGTVSDDDLEKNVQLFWDALARRDKAAALQQVHPEDLNNFLNRGEGQLNSWRLKSIERKSETEATVFVIANRQLKPNLARDSLAKYSWERTEEGWRVRVPSRRESVRQAYDFISKKSELPSELKVGPKTLRFYATSPTQAGVITIANGLESPVQVTELEFDDERFELLDSVDQIEPRSTETIRLLFVGSEKEENLESMATLKLLEGETTHQYSIPIIYNFMNDIMRWADKQRGRKKP